MNFNLNRLPLFVVYSLYRVQLLHELHVSEKIFSYELIIKSSFNLAYGSYSSSLTPSLSVSSMRDLPTPPKPFLTQLPVTSQVPIRTSYESQPTTSYSSG